MVHNLLDGNRAWAAARRAATPDFFDRLAEGQQPTYFWIGCSDSRVPANVVAGLDAGQVFVHCNVANMVHWADMNLLAALEFAVDALKIRKIVLCGHHRCGGVHAATEAAPHGLADHWLEPVRRLHQRHSADLATLPDDDARRDRLSELNVMDGVVRVAQTPILQRAWARGDPVEVHGLIYGLRDGLLRNLDCTIAPLGQTGPKR